MIHIYAGNGKGKTTAAFGLAVRASGQGLKVAIFQFWKPKAIVCGEEISARKLKNIKVVKCGECHPMFMAQGSRLTSVPSTSISGTSVRGRAQGKIKRAIEKMMKEAEKAIFSKKYNMVILDEIINVVDQDFYSRAKFLELLKDVPQEIELVLTGRGDISKIEQYADYVTIMIDKKHPFRGTIGARRGIEY